MSRRYEPDRIRIEDFGDFYEGISVDECEVCGCSFYEHPPVPTYKGFIRLCDGSLVKLIKR